MHAIRHLTFPKSKDEYDIVRYCGDIADEDGDYKGQIDHIRFYGNKTFDTYNEAYNWIRENDETYANIAVGFTEYGKDNWLVKIEYHC